MGSRVPDAQSKFRLVLGPLGLEQYRQLLPQAALFQTLVDWVRNYLGIEFAWDYVLVLRRQEVPAARLGSSTQLGWTTWLTHAEPAQDARDFRLDPEAWLRQRRQPGGTRLAGDPAGTSRRDCPGRFGQSPGRALPETVGPWHGAVAAGRQRLRLYPPAAAEPAMRS